MKKTVIAISRTYGSHGTVVGRELAAKLGVPMFDKKIIEMAAEKSGLSPDYIDNLETHASSSFLFNLASSTYQAGAAAAGIAHFYDLPMSYTAFSAQTTVIKDLAQRGSCVIIGRCSDYILRSDLNCVKVFLYAEEADRIEQAKKEFGMNDKAAAAQVKKMSKGRANYYKNFTGETWGQALSHDLTINTTKVGAGGAVEVILAYLRQTGAM